VVVGHISPVGHVASVDVGYLVGGQVVEHFTGVFLNRDICIRLFINYPVTPY